MRKIWLKKECIAKSNFTISITTNVFFLCSTVKTFHIYFPLLNISFENNFDNFAERIVVLYMQLFQLKCFCTYNNNNKKVNKYAKQRRKKT